MDEKIWLKSYSDGVPAEVDCSAYPSVRHLFHEAVNRYRGQPAFTNMGTTLTYGGRQTQSRFRRIPAEAPTVGMIKGDRLAIMLPNVLQYPVVLFGFDCLQMPKIRRVQNGTAEDADRESAA